MSALREVVEEDLAGFLSLVKELEVPDDSAVENGVASPRKGESLRAIESEREILAKATAWFV